MSAEDKSENYLTLLSKEEWRVKVFYTSPSIIRAGHYTLEATTKVWNGTWLENGEEASVTVTYGNVQRTPEALRVVYGTVSRLKGLPYLPKIELKLRRNTPEPATSDDYYATVQQAVNKSWLWGEEVHAVSPNSEMRVMTLARWDWQGVYVADGVKFVESCYLHEDPTPYMVALLDKATAAEVEFTDTVPAQYGNGSIRTDEKKTELFQAEKNR